MADELTPRALIRRVANGHVTYWATSPADRDRLDPTTDELVGIALTRKRAVIGESHVWDEFCDTVALASEQLLWRDEMSAIPALEDPFGDEPRPGRVDEGTRLSLKTVGEDIADEIVTRRHRQGWSQQELADRAGIPRRTLSHYEQAENIPQTDQLIKLAEALDEERDERTTDESDESATDADGSGQPADASPRAIRRENEENGGEQA
jgi:transcriptional regulator with XRE-family HTH domain